MNNCAVVSVWMITYNHENFIKQSLESVMMQKTSFPFEIIIGEDCSTDNTRKIIKEFENKYPDIIKPIYHDINVGFYKNAYEYCLPILKGKYIACLEGDDYWTDPLKLQKQVDVMEKNPHLSMCSHQVQIINFTASSFKTLKAETKEEFNTLDLINRDWFILSSSILFKKESFIIPEWFSKLEIGDYPLQLLCSLNGNIYFINEIMSVYRKHNAGLSQTMNEEKAYNAVSAFFKYFNTYTNNKFIDVIKLKEKKARVKVVELFAHDVINKSYFTKEYWNDYLKIFKYSNLKTRLHLKYLIKYLFPN